MMRDVVDALHNMINAGCGHHMLDVNPCVHELMRLPAVVAPSE